MRDTYASIILWRARVDTSQGESRLSREQKEWRDPRDGQRWVVSREEDGDALAIVFRVPGKPEAGYSIPIDTELSLMRTSDGRLAELLDRARGTPPP